MRFKYCIKFQLKNYTYSRYFKGNNPNQAIINCLKHHKNANVRNIRVEGDALPVAKDYAAKKIITEKQKKINKIKRWQAALKYQRLTGLNVYETKPRKNH